MTMKRSYLRLLAAALTLSVFGALMAPGAAGANEGNGPQERTYVITVENLTDGQPFTPPVAVTHRQSTSVFTVGAPASPSVQGVAENGNVPGLVADLAGNGMVDEVVVGDAAGPVLPQTEVSFEVTAGPGHRRLSLISMLICTNDGFTGLDGIKLPNQTGGSTVIEVGAYDAGTEVNTESFDDLVPPCGPLTGVDSGGAGTGMSNPALAEGGVIHAHAGVVGSGDLLPGLHGWTDPAARITVTRVA